MNQNHDTNPPETRIVFATEKDVSDIFFFIRQLAIYEKLEQEVVATEEKLRQTLFGERRVAEVLFLEEIQKQNKDTQEPTSTKSKRMGFALFFHNYSTFLAKPGIYLEDLFVLPEARGKGYGKKLLSYLAQLAVQRDCGRLEWSVLNWNKPAIDFYLSLGAKPMSEWTVQRMTGDSLKALAAYHDHG